MPTCYFLSSTNHYQSHVQSFGKVLKVFRTFLRFIRFYSDYFPRWGNLGLLGFCYELRCSKIGGGSQIKAKMEVILQENGGIHRKQHKVHFSIPVLVGFSERCKDSFLLTLFQRKLCLHFRFHEWALGLAMCADCGTIYLIFSPCKFSALWKGSFNHSYP